MRSTVMEPVAYFLRAGHHDRGHGSVGTVMKACRASTVVRTRAAQPGHTVPGALAHPKLAVRPELETTGQRQFAGSLSLATETERKTPSEPKIRTSCDCTSATISRPHGSSTIDSIRVNR